jgi:hypothetical protein
MTQALEARLHEAADERPIAADLFCGLGGWTEGLLAEGYRVRGYDIEEHVYGEERYPAELILRDVMQMHGSELADVNLIVASPPCQEYSYMAMPWSLAKAKAAAIRADETGEAFKKLTALFNACFRIQREACEAAGRHIPMVVENVRGAQEWVGKARANFGSYYLWGDVPALMPKPFDARKNPGFRFDGSGRSFQSESVSRHVGDGRKGAGAGAGAAWFDGNLCVKSSKSSARKAASAEIAKIPFGLSTHIARVYRPASASSQAAA